MGYSNSAETVKRRRDLLGPLMQGEPARWTCAGGEEGYIAYQVRECLHIARRYPEIFPELNKAARTFSVTIIGPGEVVARPKRDESLPAIKVGPVGSAEAVQDGGRSSVEQIVDRWIKSKTDSLLFPDANLSREDLLRLHAWAAEQGLLVFWSSMNNQITLRTHTEELAEFAFNPEEDL